jgi:hypothetical protein
MTNTEEASKQLDIRLVSHAPPSLVCGHAQVAVAQEAACQHSVRQQRDAMLLTHRRKVQPGAAVKDTVAYLGRR